MCPTRQVGVSCSRAINAICSIRRRLDSSHEISAEQKANFAPYAESKAKKHRTGQKGQSWTVKVVLSNQDATRVPCSVAEREILVQAGLGGKTIVIPDVTCSSAEFRSIIGIS